MKNIDCADSYFEDTKSGGRQAYLTKLTVVDNKLYASFEGFNSSGCKDCYIVFDTKIGKMYEFHSGEDYKLFAVTNDLPTANKFNEFKDNYNDYWSKNKKWYLP